MNETVWEMYCAEVDPDVRRIATKIVVCPLCEGTGSAWGRDFTSSEWQSMEQEEQDGYLEGVYDQQCSECFGRNVVTQPQRSGSYPVDWNYWIEYEKDYYECEQIAQQERMMGA
jgi:hypothetical protein